MYEKFINHSTICYESSTILTLSCVLLLNLFILSSDLACTNSTKISLLCQNPCQMQLLSFLSFNSLLAILRRENFFKECFRFFTVPTGSTSLYNLLKSLPLNCSLNSFLSNNEATKAELSSRRIFTPEKLPVNKSFSIIPQESRSKLSLSLRVVMLELPSIDDKNSVIYISSQALFLFLISDITSQFSSRIFTNLISFQSHVDSQMFRVLSQNSFADIFDDYTIHVLSQLKL